MIARGSRRKVAVVVALVAVAAIAVAAVGGALWRSTSRDNHSSVSASPWATSSAAVGTPKPTPRPTVLAGQPWRQLYWEQPIPATEPWFHEADCRNPPGPAGVIPSGMPSAWTRFRGKIVALAADTRTGQLMVAASDDWIHWVTLVPSDKLPFADQSLLALTATPDALVVLTQEWGYQAIHVWTSANGLSWSSEDSAVFKDGLVAGVTSGPAGIVAVGGVRRPSTIDRLTKFDDDASAWFSRNGSDWQRVELPGGSTPYEDGAVGVVALSNGFAVVGGTGFYQQVVYSPSDGAILNTDGPFFGDAIAWYSADGLHWQQASVDGNDKGAGQIQGLFEADGGLVATGTLDYGDDSADAIWTSSDGLRWKVAVDWRQAPPGPQPNYWPPLTVWPTYPGAAVYGDGHRLMAYPRSDIGPGASAFMESIDGASWHVVEATGPDRQFGCPAADPRHARRPSRFRRYRLPAGG